MTTPDPLSTYSETYSPQDPTPTFEVGGAPLPDPEPLPDDLVNETLPGSVGGVVETIKRAFIQALRTTMTGTSMGLSRPGTLHVDLEYPEAEVNYPAIWVQCSVHNLQSSGIGHQWFGDSGEVIQEWSYDGEVTLTVVALTSRERDRIADAIINFFAFSRLATHSGNSAPSLYKSLAENPYVSMNVNSDQLTSGGQSTTVGVPWDPDRIAYEDNYKFSLHGQFQSMYVPETGATRLRAIDLHPETDPNISGPRQIRPGTWV